MKLLFSVVATCLVSAPCLAQTDVATESVPPAPKSAATADALVWRFAPPVGSTGQLRGWRQLKRVDWPQAGRKHSSVVTQTTQHYLADYKIWNVDRFGATTLNITFRTVQFARSVTRDGKQSLAHKITINPSADGVDLVVSTKIAPNGAVWGIEVTAGLKLQMMQRAGAASEPDTRAFLAQSVDDFLSRSALHTMLTQMFGVIPTYPIRPGENWTIQTEFGEFPLTVTRTLKILDANSASLSGQMKLGGQIFGLDYPDNTQGTLDLRRLNGVGNSFMRVERNGGLPMETRSHLRVRGLVAERKFNSLGETLWQSSELIDQAVETRIVMQPR